MTFGTASCFWPFTACSIIRPAVVSLGSRTLLLLMQLFSSNFAVYTRHGTLYMVFRIHLARLPSEQHIVYGFSHTFGPFTLGAAHCMRFFAYIGSGCPRCGTLYAVFRIHWVRLPSARHIVWKNKRGFRRFLLRGI